VGGLYRVFGDGAEHYLAVEVEYLDFGVRSEAILLPYSRRGVGSSLLRYIFDQARRNGIPRATFYQEPPPGPAPERPPPEEWARFKETMALLRLGDPERRVQELFQDISVRSDLGMEEVPTFGRIGIVGTSLQKGLAGRVVTYRIGYYSPSGFRFKVRTIALITCTDGRVSSISLP